MNLIEPRNFCLEKNPKNENFFGFMSHLETPDGQFLDFSFSAWKGSQYCYFAELFISISNPYVLWILKLNLGTKHVHQNFEINIIILLDVKIYFCWYLHFVQESYLAKHGHLKCPARYRIDHHHLHSIKT